MVCKASQPSLTRAFSSSGTHAVPVTFFNTKVNSDQNQPKKQATQVPSLCCHTAHQPFTTSVLVQSSPLHSSPNLISAQDMPDSSSPFSPPLSIIDITPYLPSSSSSSSPAFTERAKVAQSLHQACRDLGFSVSASPPSSTPGNVPRSSISVGSSSGGRRRRRMR